MPTCASCRLGVDGERGAELLLGGARAPLLEQPPAVRQQLLGVGRRGRRDRRLLVGGEVALLVFLSRAARAGDRCGPPRRAARAPWPSSPSFLAAFFAALGGVVVVVRVVVIVRVVVRRARPTSCATWGSPLPWPLDDVPCWGRDLTVKKPSRSWAALVWPHHRAPGDARARPSGPAAGGGGRDDAALSADRDQGCSRSASGRSLAARAGGRRDGRPHLSHRRGPAPPAGRRRAHRSARRRGRGAGARAQDHPRAEAGARAEGDRPFVRPARGGADVRRRDRRAARARSARPARRRPAVRRGAEPAARRFPRPAPAPRC